ncbi:MAG: 50S ribosomal protein L4 [Candidatus Cloacimonetes bacterium 4572_55]|nr:MAG: 50S ribosomal protein L4 [Candidatus Cloacimonetes bacterium 4572_55]
MRMPTVNVINIVGDKVDTIELPDSIFGIKPNSQVVSEYVRMYLANQRIGSANTKNRSAVAGGGAKPYRQKGTGRARQGTIRAGQFVGGGRIFGPSPRDFHYTMPKKKKRLALCSVLSDRVRNSKCMVVERLELQDDKTGSVAAFIKNLDAESKNYLIVTSDYEGVLVRCGRNIPYVAVKQWVDLNAYEALKHEFILIDKKIVDSLKEKAG